MALRITGLLEDTPDPSINAKGGTELMGGWLKDHIDPELLSKFQIVRSRVRNLDPNKIKLLWLHDLPGDPESQHLKDKSSRERFTKLIFVSHWQQQMYNTILHVPYADGVVLQNAINPFNASELVKPDPNKELRIIYHTTPHRGLDILVPVFEELAKKYPNIHLDVYSSFNIYGWPERDKPYEHLFERCRKHPQITYHGFQPNEVVREALKKSHIFAFPSIWPETSCIAAIEAAASKNLVVAPTLGAIPETLANWGTLYSWNEDINMHGNTFYSVLDMAIQAMMNNNGPLNNALDAQRQYFNHFYSWEIRKQQWEQLLRALAWKEEQAQPSPSHSEPSGPQDQ